MSCVWVLQREPSGDGCDLSSTLCKYDLRKEDLFVLSWGDPGMSLNCAPTRVCRKSTSRPGYVVKVRPDPGYVVKQCPRIVIGTDITDLICVDCAVKNRF